VGPRLTLATQFTRAVSASLYRGAGYSIVTEFDGSLSYKVSSHIAASVGGSWGRSDYKNQAIANLSGILPTPDWQDTTTVYGQVSVQIGRRAAASLNVRHLIGGSTLSLYNYTSDYVGLTLSTAF
jgi:hypothetical protein